MIVFSESVEFTKEQMDRCVALHQGCDFLRLVHLIQGEVHDGSIFDDFLILEDCMGDSIGVVFTGPDKALLDRSARAAEAQAKLLGWEALTGSDRKKAKLAYDRLMRDAHDLRLMGVRLTKVAKALRTPSPAIVLDAPTRLRPLVVAPGHAGPDRRDADRRKNVSPQGWVGGGPDGLERRAHGDRRQTT